MSGDTYLGYLLYVASVIRAFQRAEVIIESPTVGRTAPQASAPFRGLIFPLAIAAMLVWQASRYLPATLGIALGGGLILLAVLGLRWVKSGRVRAEHQFIVALSGVVILSDYIPSDVRLVGLVITGIGLGVALALAPLCVSELRPHWAVWGSSGFLLIAMVVSGTVGINQFETRQFDALIGLWLVPSTLFGLGFIKVFARTATGSGILTPANAPDGTHVKTAGVSYGTFNIEQIFESLPFVLVVGGMLIGTYALRAEIGAEPMSLLLGGTLLTGVVLLARGGLRAGWQVWGALALCWGSLQIAATQLTAPWSQIVLLSLSGGLIAAIVLAATGRAWVQRLVPVRSWDEAAFALTMPIAWFAATISLAF